MGKSTETLSDGSTDTGDSNGEDCGAGAGRVTPWRVGARQRGGADIPEGRGTGDWHIYTVADPFGDPEGWFAASPTVDKTGEVRFSCMTEGHVLTAGTPVLEAFAEGLGTGLPGLGQLEGMAVRLKVAALRLGSHVPPERGEHQDSHGWRDWRRWRWRSGAGSPTNGSYSRKGR